MAVVISASDETFRGSFCYGGLVAPISYWEGIFAQRWDKRVLAGPPRIKYLHMTEIRSAAWRKENDISAEDADRRVGQAINLICKRKDPALFSFKFDGDFFNQNIKREIRKSTGGSMWLMADYFGFLGYVYVVLHSVRKAMPEAERVDFLVERNGEVTKNLHLFYSEIPIFLTSINRQNLIPLMGEIIPGGKDRSPLQAADVFSWYLRRGSEHTLTGNDLARWEQLQSSKKYCFGSLKNEALAQLAEAFDRGQVELSEMEQMTKKEERYERPMGVNREFDKFNTAMDTILQADPSKVKAEMEAEKQTRKERRELQLTRHPAKGKRGSGAIQNE